VTNLASTGTTQVAETFLGCLDRATHQTVPYDYWLLRDALPASDISAIADLPFAPPEGAVFNGKRETNNSLRVFFNPEAQQKFAVCRRLVAGFNDPRVRRAIEKTTGTDLSNTHLRIEYCQDSPGFWLEPHTDIAPKKFSMSIYLTDNPGLKLAGTDIFQGPPDFNYVTSAPFGKNLGMIFIPAKNTWHGVGHHPVQELRKSIIVNYVTSDWRATSELA
jgi:hypothetical protein